MLEPILIQLQFFLCPKCHQAGLFGQDSWKKHNEMCNNGHQYGELEKESSEGRAGTRSGKAEGNKSQVEQDNNETGSVSRAVNDGLSVRSKQSNETLDESCGIKAGLKVAVECRPNQGRVSGYREDWPLNEKAGTSGSFFAGKGKPTQEVLLTNFESGNKGGATSSSRTHLPQGSTVQKKSTMERVLTGTAANATVLVEKTYYFRCKLCDQEFKRLHDLRDHLESTHKVDPVRASAIVMELQNSEADNNEDGFPSVTYNGDSSPNVEAMDVEAQAINDQERSSAGRSSNRMQPPADGIVRCKWCKKSFAQNLHLTDHNRRDHPNQKIYKCALCRFKTARNLTKEHYSRSHGITQDQRTVASTSRPPRRRCAQNAFELIKACIHSEERTAATAIRRVRL